MQEKYYYGEETRRALANFSLGHAVVNPSLIEAIVLVKKACCEANMASGLLDEMRGSWILKACDTILSPPFKAEFPRHFPLHPCQGGAGTSTHMNVNEVIVGLAHDLQEQEGKEPLNLHPLDHVNLSQSTNDVYPTALRIAAIYKLRRLAEVMAELQESLQEKETDFATILKLARTQLMDALPMTLGQSFGAFARAVSRDRWRIYKVEERLREVNLGGTAIGTGLNASHSYIFRVTDALQRVTGLGLARSEYPIDTTQNADVFVEASGLLKAAATTLLKVSNDIRLMASGPRGGLGELIIPERQVGSTIMPGKVNPVMAEMMGTVAMQVMANDSAITMAAASGQLELNAFMPLIAHSLLESLDLMINGVGLFNRHLIEGIKANPHQCFEHLEKSTALVTALSHYIGYERGAALAKEMLETGKSLEALLIEKNLMTSVDYHKMINPLEITSPGIPGKRG